MTEIKKGIRDLNGYELANMAAVNAGHGKAGSEMLDTIRVCIAEAIENGEIHNDDADIMNDARLAEIADSCIPVYTTDLFEALVELQAWDEELDIITDLIQGAQVCLYQVGERLARALAVEYAPEPVEA